MPIDTFTIALGAHDEYVKTRDNEPAYPIAAPVLSRNTTGSSLYAARSRAGAGAFYVRVCLLRWDTSTLAGATITSATLRFFANGAQTLDTDGLSLAADWYLSTGVDASDYSYAPGTNAHAGTAIASLATGTDNDLTLLDPNTNINKAGFTGVRLHVLQRASDAAPTGANQVDIRSFESSASTAPRLLVNYSSGGGDLVGAVGI